MKLKSIQCKEALNNYPVKNDLDVLAIKVILAKPEEIIWIPDIIWMDEVQRERLGIVVEGIKDNIGIED